MAGDRTLRQVKACDTCRRKKTRCDGKRPICASCRAFNLPCVFQDGANRRRSNKKYIQELEERVREMESMLQSQTPSVGEAAGSEENSVNSDTNDFDQESLSNNGDGVEIDQVPLVAQQNQLLSTQETSKDLGKTDQSQSPYVVNAPNGTMRYFGPSSGFSAISPSGSYPEDPIEPIERRRYHQGFHSSGSRWQITGWMPQVLQEDPAHRVFQSLPDKQTTTALVGKFFRNFNKALPLFEEESFMKSVEKQFSWNPNESPSWWAALNVVLAISYKEQAQEMPDGSDDWKRSLGHVRNALNVVVELFMRSADLLAVQGMLGIALYFQDTPNPQPPFMFVAAAMRLAQSIGLHRSSTFGCSPTQIQERKRTYWIAFILDADISSRTGRPPVQDAHDWDTPAPSDFPNDDLGIISVDGINMNFFKILAQFALIQRKIYHQLYSAAGVEKSGMRKVTEVLACEEDLLNWKNSLPDKFQAQSDLFAHNHPLMSHVLRLHFAYRCCHANLYRVFLTATRLIKSLEQSTEILTMDRDLNEAMVRSLDSARCAIDLIKYVDLFSPSFAWGVLYFAAAATVTLSSNLVINPPYHNQAKSDLSRIRQTIEFLTKVSSQDPGTYVDFIIHQCSNFEAQAKRVLDKAEREAEQATSVLQSTGLHPVDNLPSGHVQGFLQPNTFPSGYDQAGTAANMHNQSDFTPVNFSFETPEALLYPQFSSWAWQDMASGVPPSF